MTGQLLAEGTLGLVGPAASGVGRVLASAATAAAAAEATKWALENAASYQRQENDPPIDTMGATDLSNRISFAPVINITPQMRNDLIDASNRLVEVDGIDTLNAKLLNDLDFGSPPMVERLQGQSPEQVATIKNIVDGIDPRPVMADEDDAIVKKLKRKPTDRYYCSTQYHEYKYHVRKEWTDILDLWDLEYTGSGANGALTYGEWVDGIEYRKMIELTRAIRRSLTGPGFKRLLELLNTTKDAQVDVIVATTESQAQKTAAVTENSWLNTN